MRNFERDKALWGECCRTCQFWGKDDRHVITWRRCQHKFADRPMDGWRKCDEYEAQYAPRAHLQAPRTRAAAP